MIKEELSLLMTGSLMMKASLYTIWFWILRIILKTPLSPTTPLESPK